MAGHSKWANIQHRKGRQDEKRGKVFTRVIKEAIPLDDREAVVRAMWEVVLTDGSRDQHEDALMRMVAPLLGFTDQDSNRIRIAITKN